MKTNLVEAAEGAALARLRAALRRRHHAVRQQQLLDLRPAMGHQRTHM